MKRHLDNILCQSVCTGPPLTMCHKSKTQHIYMLSIFSLQDNLGEYAGKKIRKKCGLLPNRGAQLFEKGYRRNIQSHFGAFNTQCKFGVKLEPLTKMLVGFSFFDENG